MNNESVKIEYQETLVKPCYGGKRIGVIYNMTHLKNGRVNHYRITCEIRGIQSHDLQPIPTQAESLNEFGTIAGEFNNDETLTNESAQQLFEDNI